MNNKKVQEEEINHVGEVIQDLELINNSTDQKRSKKVQRLRKTMKELKSTHKKMEDKFSSK